VPTYLVETFLPRGAAEERSRRERRASEAAEALTRQGTRVSFGGSMHVPHEEICFFTFEADHDATVALLAERAGFGPYRVVEIDPSKERSGPPSP